MRNLAFRVEYDGTGFHGFQRQRTQALPTIQGLLEDILGTVLDEPVTVVCAGRTDAGVHALGQVVHVQTTSARPLDVVVRALVGLAHGRIGVQAAWEAPSWFHARHQASRRTYQYHVLCSPSPSPLLGRWVYQVPASLDLALMRTEARALLGRRDFRSFHSGGTDLRHFFRTVHRFDLAPATGSAPASSGGVLAAPGSKSWLAGTCGRPGLMVAEIEADAFLPHMVRMMMGTLIEVGSGRRPPGTTAAVLRARDPRRSSMPAPPQGLCLVRVAYPDACRVPPTA